MTAAALVDWGAFAKAVLAAAGAALAVVVLFSLVVVGASRRQWLLVALGALGCLAAAAVGVVAMTHK